MKKILRIEERATLPEMKELCKKNGDTKWVMFTDIDTMSTGIMPEYQLNELYKEMVGFTSNGKQLYIKR
jgi:hypothetical protein